MQSQITRTLLRLGSDRDGPPHAESAVSTVLLGCQLTEQASKCKRLYVLAEGPSWFALYKPPFWVAGGPPKAEVDADAEQKMLPEEGKEQLNMQVWINEQLAVHYMICNDAM